MDATDYQRLSIKTNIYKDIREMALGFASEAGEVAGKISKIYRDGNGEWGVEQCDEVALELGDCCWFIAALAYEIGFDLGTVMDKNIVKLADRAKRGVIGGSGDHR
jgi:NTP pyrophosphatase (non-canonical NTP hydrolase)